MKSIEFIPKEFHDVKLGFYETGRNPCSPGYPKKIFPNNKIEVNVPKKIIYRFGNSDNIRPVIPVCALYVLSSRRISKYGGVLPRKIYIARMDNREDVYSSEIYDTEPDGYDPLVSDPELAKEFGKIKAELRKEAEKYADDELEDGFNRGWCTNIDVLKYVDIPIQSGKYEVWITSHNMESNHAIVEIVVE